MIGAKTSNRSDKFTVEVVEGIEPSHKNWQFFRLPLHHTTIDNHKYIRLTKKVKPFDIF